MLDSLITSKTRLRLLVKFFINPQTHSHLRGLAEEFGESTNSIRKELNNLSQAGYLEKSSDKNKISYSANSKHPLFNLLQGIIRKYIGLDTVVEEVLERMGEVQQVVLTGDYADGQDTGTIDIDIVGKKLNGEYLDQLAQKIERLINRKVNFTLVSVEEAGKGSGLILFDQKG
ncbi:ArsR family transcriptional regulator [Echinicola jeungdonensis]|uniref:ArsR family transcriptional regulator n=1 Tax=Echinicola jeungdonensis TaxID=709343 RepID=A0ABV5J2U3_9BACT|nr:ArsR family transcriptional regulator [Echinicola jeungdonensis]MDN3668136.1 ArsR family transcriptional regulator [Echinicola jeungdonensis]